MKTTYQGPLRHEPLALELHNTLYAARGELIDGLETPADLRAWLAGIADRLPPRGRNADTSRHAEFIELRHAVREVLHATLESKRVPRTALRAINDAAARAPVSPYAVARPGRQVRAEPLHHAANPTDVALATLAGDAIDLLTGPEREHLRACGAPGCVLMFLKDHPRRTWCSPACGNRARQARHYERVRSTRR